VADRSFFAELRKRRVFQAAAIYGAVAWGVTEVLVTIVEQLFLPQWVSTLAVIGFVVGFPVAMFLAWTFDITADGIRRAGIASRRGTASIVVSLLLLVVGTAGLFFLIRPALQQREAVLAPLDILPNSMAVLPFQNVGEESGAAYLSEGLGDELREQLGRVAGLRMAARSSSIAAHKRQADARSVAAELSVAMLVEGSLRRRGNGLRVSVELIDGATGLALWSATYDRGEQELLALQQEIAGEVIRRLLPDAEPKLAEPVTRSATANELLLLARYYEQQVRGREEVDRRTLLEVIRLYREATEADPASALAQSRLAGALLYLGDLEAAEAPIFKALSLDPELSEVQHTLGLYYFARGVPDALPAFRRAVELNPNSADALESYAFSLWIGRDDQHAASLLRRALELDPLSLSRFGALGELLGKEGKSAEVYELVDRIEELFDGPDACRMISRLLDLTGDVDRAIAWAMRARDLEPTNPDHIDWLAELYATIGDFDTVRKLAPKPGIGLLYLMRRYDELIELAEELMIDEPEDVPLRYLLAFAYNASGRYESAMWVLSTTGQPDILMKMPRMGADYEGYFTLVNAVNGTGDRDLAADLATWYLDQPIHHENLDWFVEINMACMLALLDRDSEALNKFGLARRSPRLPPQPVLEDMPCFERFAGEPVYRATLEHFEARRAALRERLPLTLAKFDVSP
jgi:TolB-like protein/thioredoxin-like negative regulator of GroEL